MTSKNPSDKASSKKRATRPAVASPSTPAASGGGLKVQVIYLAARSVSASAKAPVKDALWFATYPIIPRIGDCLFRDGVYYRVEHVFLYENTAPGWCADIEVSYYGRR